MLSIIKELNQKGAIRQLDYQFALFIASQERMHSEIIGFVAGVLSSELAKGHICIQLQDFDFAKALGVYTSADLESVKPAYTLNWPELFEIANCVGKPGESKPMIFDRGRLYLHRYWFYEQTLADKLNAFSHSIPLDTTKTKALRKTLDHLFARQYQYLFSALENEEASVLRRQQLVCDYLDIVDPENLDWIEIDKALSLPDKANQSQVLDKLIPLSACLNWQKVAAGVALSRQFSVISGGPGTGKTTTVAKLLAAIVEQAQQEHEMLSIKLVAPTGKAAARLTESLANALSTLAVSQQVKGAIPTEASTIHRLLGAVPNRAEFRHNAGNPLHLDLLVVDEASMVDLPMMHKLLDALPSHARLIFLGDKDQLSSVEAGAILGDICSFNKQGYSNAQCHILSELTGFENFQRSGNEDSLADCLCMLQKSYRFDARSGIGQLAKVTNEGQSQAVNQVFDKYDDIELYPLGEGYYQHMLDCITESYRSYLTEIKKGKASERALDILNMFGQSRLLCAVREGDYGISGLNQRIEKALIRKGLIHPGVDMWYPGRPIMITRNDYSQGLYNGDIGICIVDDLNNEPKLKVYFEMPDGSIKAVMPSRVPEHETAFAMTIHKSQGSEFEAPMLILPPQFSPVLTKELIYTGITRAKKHLKVYAEQVVLRKGISTRTERNSGLVDRLSI